MSITEYRLQTASFPDGYAEVLTEKLSIGPDNFLSVKDILYHFRLMDDDEAADVMRHIAELAADRQSLGRRP